MSDTELVGSKVILVGNDGPPIVGHLVEWQPMPARKYFPVVRLEDGKEVLTFGIMLPYDEGLLNYLNSLPGKGAWELCRNISIMLQVRNRKTSG